MELIKAEQIKNLDQNKKDLERQAWADAQKFLEDADSITSYGHLKQFDAYLKAFMSVVYDQAKRDFEERQEMQEGKLVIHAGNHAVITDRMSRQTYDYSKCPHVVKAKQIVKDLEAKAIESGCATIKTESKLTLNVDLR